VPMWAEPRVIRCWIRFLVAFMCRGTNAECPERGWPAKTNTELNTTILGKGKATGLQREVKTT